MTYSSAGLLALIIHLVINHDVLWSRSQELVPAHRSYRQFLFAVTVYYISDVLWGFLYDRQMIRLCFLDTAVYFVAMAFSILLWTRYVIIYLEEKDRFGQILAMLGWLIFAFQVMVVAINFFVPVLYYFDDQNAYHAEIARYITLSVQLFMFVITAAYAWNDVIKSAGTMKLRYRTIGLFSAAMAGFVTGQAFYPLLPLYAIGCMIGGCLLHSFVLENEKEEYRESLETRLEDNILKGNYYDLLTGLPGMSYFFDLTRARRQELTRKGAKPAFLYFNLSGLKFYNQNHGFAQGDHLLRSFAQLLVTHFGSDSCSRFGQDHFAAFTETEGVEDTLNDLFREWERIDGEAPAILAGIYSDDVSVIDLNTAYDWAKTACDEISTTYASSFRYFDVPMYVKAQKQQYFISHLDQALSEKWIKVYYHPIVRAANGKVCEEEALARWDDPEGGLLPPADFIPVLEKVNLIYKLDLYMVEQVLEKLKKTREAGLFLVPQSVNLSRTDFDSCDMVEEIRQRVDAVHLPHRLLTIEITESIIGSDFEFIKEQIERFRHLGFPVWMDDFGSGYSSLDVLQGIQFDLIKFDMRFMQQFDHGDKSRIILTELMKMAIGLGIDTVCEGVEREDQVEFLREIGCSKLQGYYYTRPISLEQLFERYEKGIQIGFENPEESSYFDTIDRISLYDLGEITREESDSFQRYFSTVPMAIIEVCKEKVRFARTNPAFRDFTKLIFYSDDAVFSGTFGDMPDVLNQFYLKMLDRCCRNDGREYFDDEWPGGIVVRAFLRRIAENPLTDTVAAAVAILTVDRKEEKTGIAES